MVIPQDTRGKKRFFWDIVCNNYTDELCESVKVSFDEIADAYVIGKEIGESGTPHLQMCIKLKKGNYKSFLINRLGKKFSIREGRNINAMREYCMKDSVWASKNVERIASSIPFDEKVNNMFSFEYINRKELYDKFLREVSKDMDGYWDLEKYLRDNLEKDDYVRYRL